MKDEFQRYLDRQFASYKKSKEMSDFKDEVLTNLSDRYDEFKAQGFSDKESYDKSIEAVGDYTHILKSIDAKTPTKTAWAYSKLIFSVSALYFIILFTVYAAVSFWVEAWNQTWLILLVGCVVYAVVMLAFGAKNAAVTGKNAKMRIQTTMTFLVVTLLAYFTVSFVTHAWDKTWLIFVDSFALWSTVDLALAKLKERKRPLNLRVDFAIMNWSIAAYLTASVLVGTITFWKTSWLIFLVGLAAVFVHRSVLYYKKYAAEIKSGK
jgi:hypothetical protein